MLFRRHSLPSRVHLSIHQATLDCTLQRYTQNLRHTIVCLPAHATLRKQQKPGPDTHSVRTVLSAHRNCRQHSVSALFFVLKPRFSPVSAVGIRTQLLLSVPICCYPYRAISFHTQMQLRIPHRLLSSPRLCIPYLETVFHTSDHPAKPHVQRRFQFPAFYGAHPQRAPVGWGTRAGAPTCPVLQRCYEH